MVLVGKLCDFNLCFDFQLHGKFRVPTTAVFGIKRVLIRCACKNGERDIGACHIAIDDNTILSLRARQSTWQHSHGDGEDRNGSSDDKKKENAKKI